MSPFRKILIFILLLQAVTCVFGSGLSRDTLQNNEDSIVGQKSELFQPLVFYYQAGAYIPAETDCLLIIKSYSKTVNKSSLSFIISAYTDPTGSDSYNQQLSELRAEQVKKIFVKTGIPETRIIIKAFGESQSGKMGLSEYNKMRKVEIKPIIMMK